jgi:hypothetical protein
MSPASCAGGPPGPRSESPGTAELLCPSYRSGLTVAEQMEHGTSTAFVDVQFERVPGLEAVRPEAVFYGALLKDVGRGAVLAPFFADQEVVPGSASSWLTCTVRAACRPALGARCGWTLPSPVTWSRAQRQMTARRRRNTGVPGAYAVREE